MPYCPVCKYEYRPDVDRCPDCGARLVDQLPEDPEPPDVEFAQVASYRTDLEAQEARLRLKASGIWSVIVNETMSQTDIAMAWAEGGVKLAVRKEDATRATRILTDT